jgi:hypothetical protein
MARSPCRNAGLCLEHVYQTRLLLLGSRGRRRCVDSDARRLVIDQMLERPAALDVHKERVTA